MNLRRCRNVKQLEAVCALAIGALKTGILPASERTVLWLNVGQIMHCAELVQSNTRRTARLAARIDALYASAGGDRDRIDPRRAVRLLRYHRRLRRRKAFVRRYTLTMPWPARLIELARDAAAPNAGGNPS